VTVLFADLSGSTTLGERLDPEELRQILAAFFSAIARQIQRFGGTIDKYIGDAVMAVFGAPLAHEDDPQRAIRAALAIQAAITRENDNLEQRYGARLALRIGLNTGEVVAGVLAGDVQSAYTVVGDTVNTAQRLESAAPPGEVLVGATTYDLARHAFVFEAVPPLTLKGKSERVPAYRVLGPSDEALDRDAPPFVGRRLELVRLAELLTEATAGRGQVVNLYGEPGVGKSRLLHQFFRGLPESIAWVRARCLSHASAAPYALLADLARRAFRIHPADAEGPARTALLAGLVALGLPAEEASTAVILEILGYGQPSMLDPESKRRLLISFFRQLLNRQAFTQPLVLVTEDVHWIDPASAAILRELAPDVNALPCLFLSTSREASVPWEAAALPLEPLDATTAAELVDKTAGAPLDSSLRALVLERTGGNPFFIAEVVRTVAGGQSRTVPATVQEVLAARLDRLPPTSRRVVQRAAVIGRTFSTRILARVCEDPLEPALVTLENDAFITPRGVIPEPMYAFRHALMQDVAYQTQLMAQRRTIHTQVGAAIEELYPDRLDEWVDALAFHFGRSDNDPKALVWLMRAGDRARALFANEEALTSYRAALQRAADGEGERDAGTILQRIGDVLTLTGHYADALASFREARERIGAPQPATSARLHRKVGLAFRLKGAYADAAAAFSQGLNALGSEDDLEAARIQIQVGQLHYRHGTHEAAVDASSTAVALAQRLKAQDVVAEGLTLLGNALNSLGDLRGAIARYEQSRAIYEHLEDLAGIADVRANLGMVYRRMGRWDEALAEYRASLAFYERAGNLWKMATCHNNIGEVHRTRGEPREGIPFFERAIAIFEGIGSVAEAAVGLMNLGAARVEAGELSQGRADLLQAQERFQVLGRTSYLPGLYRYRASAELAVGDLEAASNAAERSLALAREAKARHLAAMAQRVLAEIALARGQKSAARAMLESSRDTLAELGEAAELARTEAVLRAASE